MSKCNIKIIEVVFFKKVEFKVQIAKLLLFLVVGIILGLLFSSIFFSKEKDLIEENNFESISYSNAVARASPAVVNIYSEQFVSNRSYDNNRMFNSIFSRRGKELRTSLGSGVIFSSDGYVLTNQHVIGDTALRVTIELNDGKKFIAQLIGIDKGTDLAVLKIQNPEYTFPSIEIENSDDVKIGDIALAIGNPYGLGQSVSMGIISATGREFDNPYSNYIQTDASINKGNSGGALVNSKGRLIGINTLIKSSSGGSEGIGLAIPSATALEIISDLIRYGEVRRGWLGFSIDRQSLIRQRKLVISEVVDGGPAYSAGLMKNDILISINSNIPSYENLFKTFARSKPGQKIYFEVERNQQNIDISIIAGEVD